MNQYQYQLGPTGNRQSATESGGRALSWSYDGIYRLTNETISSGSVNGAVAYGLDPVGNRLSQTSSLGGISTGGFTYDANGRLSTETYDNNGNTTVSGARMFAYDFQNRLKSMNSGAVALQYDGDGNRVAKTVNGVTTRYLVDDLNPSRYPQVAEVLVSGVVQRTYTYGYQRINQSQFINSTWTPSFYGYDGMGSVRRLADQGGVVTDAYDYDAWGNALNVTGSTPNVYLYRGEEYDSDLKLYYLRARYFNPLSGRFLTMDPAGGRRMVPQTQHKYVYAGSDPVNRVDPRGRANILEYTGLLFKGVKGALGADVIGCSVSVAAMIMNIVLGESPDTLGTSLTAAGCGLTFVEAAVENPFGIRTLSVVITGRLGKVIGATACASGVLDVIDKAQKYAAGPPNDDKLYGILFNTFDTTFGCTLWAAGMFGFLE